MGRPAGAGADTTAAAPSHNLICQVRDLDGRCQELGRRCRPSPPRRTIDPPLPLDLYGRTAVFAHFRCSLCQGSSLQVCAGSLRRDTNLSASHHDGRASMATDRSRRHAGRSQSPSLRSALRRRLSVRAPLLCEPTDTAPALTFGGRRTRTSPQLPPAPRRGGQSSASGTNVVYLQHDALSRGTALDTREGVAAMVVFPHARTVSGIATDALVTFMTTYLPC